MPPLASLLFNGYNPIQPKRNLSGSRLPVKEENATENTSWIRLHDLPRGLALQFLKGVGQLIGSSNNPDPVPSGLPPGDDASPL